MTRIDGLALRARSIRLPASNGRDAAADAAVADQDGVTGRRRGLLAGRMIPFILGLFAHHATKEQYMGRALRRRRYAGGIV